MTAVYQPFDRIGPVGDPVGAPGGQGGVFRLPARPGLLLKRYTVDVDVRGLEALVRWRHDLPPRARRIIDGTTSWPLAVVLTPDGPGTLLCEAPPTFWFEVVGQRTLRDLQWAYCDSVSYVGLEPIGARAAITVTHRWACLLDILHNNGVVYGDLSATNMLWSDRGARPGIFVIDCDAAWVVDAPRALTAGQTPGWDHPFGSDGSRAAEESVDRYKLGLLFLRLYYRTQVPLTESTASLDLDGGPPISRRVRDLLEASLRRDGFRPEPQAWIRALGELERRLRARGQE